MAIAELRVGPQIAADGAIIGQRAGKLGSTIVSELHGGFHEATYRGTVFNGAIVGQVTTVGLATTYTGLCLSNPVSSPVNLSIINAGVSFIVAFAAGAHVGIATGFNASTNVTHTTPVTVRKQLFSGVGGGVGLLDSAATLPTAPTVNTILASGLTGAITTAPLTVGNFVIDGQIVLSPGAYAIIYTSTASGAAGGAFSFTWEEVPV